MAFTCGFFNSVNGDRRYNSRQISQIFDGIIVDGVFAHYGTHFEITPLEGMEINVGEGRFWFNHVWGLNDGNTVVHLDPADVSSQRKDAVIIEIDESDDVRNAFIKVLKGDFYGNNPTLINTDDFHQYPLAYVTVPAGATAVDAANIQVVVGTSECPFATGVLENVSIDNLFNQWDAQFQEWFSSIQGQLEGDVLTNLVGQIEELKSSKASKEDVEEISEGVLTVNGKRYKAYINDEMYGVMNNEWPTRYIVKGESRYGVVTFTYSSEGYLAKCSIYDYDNNFIKEISSDPVSYGDGSTQFNYSFIVLIKDSAINYSDFVLYDSNNLYSRDEDGTAMLFKILSYGDVSCWIIDINLEKIVSIPNILVDCTQSSGYTINSIGYIGHENGTYICMYKEYYYTSNLTTIRWKYVAIDTTSASPAPSTSVLLDTSRRDAGDYTYYLGSGYALLMDVYWTSGGMASMGTYLYKIQNKRMALVSNMTTSGFTNNNFIGQPVYMDNKKIMFTNGYSFDLITKSFTTYSSSGLYSLMCYIGHYNGVGMFMSRNGYITSFIDNEDGAIGVISETYSPFIYEDAVAYTYASTAYNTSLYSISGTTSPDLRNFVLNMFGINKRTIHSDSIPAIPNYVTSYTFHPSDKSFTKNMQLYTTGIDQRFLETKYSFNLSKLGSTATLTINDGRIIKSNDIYDILINGHIGSPMRTQQYFTGSFIGISMSKIPYEKLIFLVSPYIYFQDFDEEDSTMQLQNS